MRLQAGYCRAKYQVKVGQLFCKKNVFPTIFKIVFIKILRCKAMAMAAMVNGKPFRIVD